MTHSTVTLTGTYLNFDGVTPAEGVIEIIPSVKVVIDEDGNTILSGRVKVTLVDGAFSVDLPATDDARLNPTGFGYTVSAKLRHQHLAAVSFALPAGSGPVYMAEVTPADPASFVPTTTYAPLADLDALGDRVGSVESTVTSLDAAVTAAQTAASTAATTASEAQTLATTAQATADAALPEAEADAAFAGWVADDGSETSAALKATIVGEVADPDSPTGQALSAATEAIIAPVTAGQPATLIGPTFRVPDVGEPIPLTVIDGDLYGYSGTTLSKSTDNGVTWTSVSTTLPGSPVRMFACDDGEMLVANGTTLSKSSGWAADPATATWTMKITTYADATFSYFSVDGDGTKFIANEYNGTTRANSRYVHISTDAGETWATVWDAGTEFPSETASHLHGCCYDRWDDRFWFGYAHSASHGLYYSDDDGATWVRLTGGLADSLVSLPTVLVATDDGIVCGADSDEPGGLLGIRRALDPADMALESVWHLHLPVAGTNSQANMGWRDETTGIVYIGFKSQAATSATIVAGTATSGAGVWTSDSALTGDAIWSLCVTGDGALAAWGKDGGGVTTKVLYAKTGRSGGVVHDSGGVLGGVASGPASRAFGAGADASGSNAHALGIGATASGSNSLALGPEANTDGTYGTAVGYQSHAGNNGVAVGKGAAATGVDKSVAIGTNAGASTNAVAVGDGASALYSATLSIGVLATTSASNASAVGYGTQAGSNGTALGRGATATGADKSTALGATSGATGISCVAVGYGATATHNNTVALGASTTTTAANQVMIGDRDVESTRTGGGIILKSPDGTRYKITVANGGTLAVAAA